MEFGRFLADMDNMATTFNTVTSTTWPYQVGIYPFVNRTIADVPVKQNPGKLNPQNLIAAIQAAMNRENGDKVIQSLNDCMESFKPEPISLTKSISELKLSVRATNCLENAGITRIADLVVLSEDELLEIRNFGEATLREVRNKLAVFGLRIGLKPHEINQVKIEDVEPDATDKAYEELRGFSEKNMRDLIADD